MDAVEIRGISKRFTDQSGYIWALKDVSFSVQEGEVFGLLGPNGAGKTTMMNIVSRLVEPDAGEILILGRPSKEMYSQMNTVMGDGRFLGVARVEDILSFFARVYGLSHSERQKRMNDLLSFFRLDGLRTRKFYALSTGERMRLLLAKSLINHPRVLLMDEPTLGLDPAIAASVREEIGRLQREFKTTIILTSHIMQEVEQLADRIAFLYKGQIQDIGTVREITSKKRGIELVLRLKHADRANLKKLGFTATGRVARILLPSEDDIGRILSALHEKGVVIQEVETRRPSLESYFLKMAEGS